MKKLSCLFLALVLILSLLPISISAASNDVYVSSSGNDQSSGTMSTPYKTLEKALTSVSDGGTIHIVGTVSLASNYTWASHDKSVTITGGTLDFTAISINVTIGDNVEFTGITLKFDAGDNLFAAGNRVVIGESVALNATINLYGGGNGTTVKSTNLTVLSGNYSAIYGGGKGGTVSGDSHLTVGGNTNASANPASHGKSHLIYGGSNNGIINGTAYLTFTGNAKANYIYGGSNGSDAVLKGGSNTVFSGGQAMSIYGGSVGSDQKSNINLTVSGGQVQQVFGGGSVSHTGDVSLWLLGGKITRRVYGGCYNEVSSTGSWQSSYYVKGNIRVTVGGNVKITFDATEENSTSKYNDRSFYAHSRQRSLSSDEYSEIIFADATAYDSYKNKLKAQDWAMQIIMAGVSAADAIHYFTYTASGATITGKCANHNSETVSATLTIDESASLGYTGKPVTPVKVTYNNWYAEELTITYSNNEKVGTATAAATVGGATASITFSITPGTPEAPKLTKSDETIRGKNDGQVFGLTTDMEYCLQGGSYSPVTNTSMTFAPGTYSFRYKATASYNASPATTITIAEGKMLKVTFQADGVTVAVREVMWNGTLTDIPQVPAKAGYDQTAPQWDRTDFTGIQKDLTVKAVYTINRYTVEFVVDGVVMETATVEHGGNVTLPTIPPKTGYDAQWDHNGKNITCNTTIQAVYIPVGSGNYTSSDSRDNFGGGTLTQSGQQLRPVIPMTEDEKAMVANGTDVNLIFSILEITGSDASGASDAALKAVSGSKLAAVLELGMTKQLGNQAAVSLTKLDGKVTVKLTLPSNLISQDPEILRSYTVVRIANGKAETINTTLFRNVLQFSFDTFGTYVLVMTDTDISQPEPPVAEDPTEPSVPSQQPQDTSPTVPNHTSPSQPTQDNGTAESETSLPTKNPPSTRNIILIAIIIVCMILATVLIILLLKKPNP